MKAFKAEPGRVASFAPGREQAMLSRPGHPLRRANAREVLDSNVPNEKTPIERFDQRFIEAMRAKGWLKQ